jgi:CheY-like chemotaxis protein
MYSVVCASCRSPFDASVAAECDCVQATRSFKCPHCGNCFCSAPQDYINAFWKDAPAEIGDRRRTMGGGAQMQMPPAMIKRPMVLFADDDAVGRKIAQQMITNLGYGVVVADNGDDALTAARKYKPELVITDALMPRLDGRELAKKIKDEKLSPRVVVITGIYKDARYKTEAHRSFEVDEYLPKPLSADRLKELLEKYLGPGES